MRENLVPIIIAALFGLLVGASVTGATSMWQNPQPDSAMPSMSKNVDIENMQSDQRGTMGSVMMMGGMMQEMDDMMNAAGHENMMAEHMAMCKEMMKNMMEHTH